MDDFVGTSSDSVPPAPEGENVKEDYNPPSLYLNTKDFAKMGVDPGALQVGQEYKVTMHLRVSGLRDDGGTGVTTGPEVPAGPAGSSADFQILGMEGFQDTGEQHSPGEQGVAEEQSEDDSSPDEKSAGAKEAEDDDAAASKALGFDYGAMKKAAKVKKPTPKLSAKDLQD